MPEETFLFTSESVGEGHPDKCCDQISDAVLDACLAQDPHSKVACETAAKSNYVLLFGEISTKATTNLEQVVRDTLRKIGYDDAKKGIDCDTCRVEVSLCSISGLDILCTEQNPVYGLNHRLPAFRKQNYCTYFRLGDKLGTYHLITMYTST